VVTCLRRLFRAVHEYSKALHQRAGLSSPQLWALHLLAEQPNLSLKGLSERMFSHPSTVSGVVARLTRRGLVRRETDGSDRRGILLRLTPGGRRLLRAAPPPLQLGLRRALSEMPAGRLRELSRSLDEIARKAEVTDVVAPLLLARGAETRPARAASADPAPARAPIRTRADRAILARR
jgi:DNA-binding MarR family transcriptional regulator